MSIWQPNYLFWIIFFVCLFSWNFLQHFFEFFFIDFDSYYIFRTDEGQPNIYFFILQRFGPYHRHRILKPSLLLTILSDTKTEWTLVTSEYRCTESVEILRCHLLYLITYLAWSIYKTDWLTLCTGRGFTLLIGWIYKWLECRPKGRMELQSI